MKEGRKKLIRTRMTEREIQLLKGVDVKPITRKEMYYRAVYHPEQMTPEPITEEERALKKLIDYVNELRGGDNGKN